MDVDLYSRLQVCVIVDIVYTVYTLYAIHYTTIHKRTTPPQYIRSGCLAARGSYHQTYHLVTYSKNIQT